MKFNHKKILRVAEGVLIYGTLTFIVTALGMIMINVIVNGAPHIPCDICY